MLTQGNDGWGINNFGMVLAHEMGHIFGALDEYAASGIRNTRRAGYLNGLTLNASLDGAGNPVVPPQPNALMLNIGNFSTGVPHSPHSSSSVNFGHRDVDGDSIPDILDTFPTLTGSDAGSNPATGKFVFSGSISVNDYPNNNPLNFGFSNSRSDMTINTIAAMSYVLNSGSPIPFTAIDGAYDDYTELLGFSISGFPAGLHTIDVYGTNSVGNTSNLLQFTFTSLVPEPGSLLLAAMGLVGLVHLRRRHIREFNGTA
jgi:MYXO-CTERM domain-containing protein